jgi:hypothetical protein
MSDMDRRAFVGTVAVGGVAAAVLAASSAVAAGQSGYFVIDAHMVAPDIKAIVPKLEPVLAKPFTQIFLEARTGG